MPPVWNVAFHDSTRKIFQVARSCRPADGIGEHRYIAGVECRTEEEDRRDAGDDLGEVTDFLLDQGAAS